MGLVFQNQVNPNPRLNTMLKKNKNASSVLNLCPGNHHMYSLLVTGNGDCVFWKTQGRTPPAVAPRKWFVRRHPGGQDTEEGPLVLVQVVLLIS